MSLVDYPMLRKGIKARPKLRPFTQGLRMVVWTTFKEITEDEEKLLFDAIVQVVSQTFGQDMSPSWRYRFDRNFLGRMTRLIFIVTKEGELASVFAYTRLNVNKKNTVYWEAASVRPEFRKRGIQMNVARYMFITEFLRGACRSLYVVARTESPILYYIGLANLGEDHVFPHFERESPPRIVEIIEAVADWLGQADKLNPKTHCIENHLDGSTGRMAAQDGAGLPQGRLPCGDDRVNEFFATQLAKTDAFLLVWHYDPYRATLPFRTLFGLLSTKRH